MESFHKKSNKLFGQIVGIGALLIIIFSATLYTSYAFVFSTLGEIFARRASVACGCQIGSATTNYPLFGLLSVLGLSVLATISIAAAKTIFTLIKTKRFLQLQQKNIQSISPKLLSAAQSLGIEKNIAEIDSVHPLIFCHGLRHVSIYISSSVINELNDSELRAVLLHEIHHLLGHEPIKLLYIKFLSTFAFLPGIKTIIKKYLSLAEIAADELATEQFTKKKYLASAMTKILDMEERHAIEKELAVSYFSQMTEDRILALSNHSFRTTVTRELLKAGVGIIGGIVVLLFLGTNIQKQQVRAQEIYTNSGCANKILVEKCQNLWTNCVGQKFHQEKILCAQTNTSYLQK